MKSNGKLVEVHLEASEFPWEIAPGKAVDAWGFNKQLPGPVIKANKGDTIVVKFKNNLNEPTTIHWHGIRLPAPMDGTDAVQKPIEPGKEFEYRFIVPDAGTFWYHSHSNETVQMERGMYGALIVYDDTEPITDDEKVIMIDDMKLTADNEFEKPGWFFARWLERHDGREGETLLINGKENSEINMSGGQIERWRIINSSSARYFLLHLQGKSFNIIGTDGGLLESPMSATEVLITPGERYDILSGPFNEGDTFLFESLPYNRMVSIKPKLQTFGTVKVGKFKPSKASIPAKLREIIPLAPQHAEVTRKIKFSVGPSLKDGVNFLINNDKHINDKPVRVGELQVWEIANTSLMDHPFHLHGFFFQVIEENGKAPEYLSWKDTYNLPPRSKIKIAWMPDNRPGTWMYHCHILEHHAAGMMAHFDIISGDQPVPETVSHHQHHHHH
ncbi:MAG: multicopper oxidase family protein [Ignavibacteriaceae bacterium]